jgi:hypothetical protein
MMGIEMKVFPSTAKIFGNGDYSAIRETLHLSALGGERVSFQAAFRQRLDWQAWGRLTVDAPPGIAVQVRRVRNMPGYVSPRYKTDDAYISTNDGVYPDLLEAMDMEWLPLSSHTWQSVWVDMFVPNGAKAGLFPVCLTLTKRNGEASASVTVQLEIINADLPKLPIPRTHWFHADCLAQYYNVAVFSEKHWEIIENFAACAVAHGMNTLLTPIHTPPLDTAVGGERLTVQLIDVSESNGIYTFDFNKLERWVSMCRKIGIEYIEIAHLYTQWGAKHAPKIMGTKNGIYQRLFGWETDALGKSYNNYLQQMLPALTRKLTEWGITDKTFFHISDEPTKAQMAHYTAARNQVTPLLHGYKIIDALTDYDFYAQGAVTVPIPSVTHIQPFVDGNVPEFWCYFCCADSYLVPNHFLMQPSYRNRILGTLLYKYNVKGFLHWGYNFYNSMHSLYPVDPMRVTDADGAFPSGDAFLVYPDPGGKPLASLRLMVAQEGFNDYCALTLLEEKIGRDGVLDLIDEGLAEPLGFARIPLDEGYVVELRRRVNGLLAGE